MDISSLRRGGIATLDILMVIGGFVALMVGGEYLVRGAVAIASRLGMSPMVIGLTLVGFGTSTPELLTSLQAAFAGSPGIAVGNVVGSNIANILLILGVAAAITPIAVNPAAFRRDGAVLIAASLAGLAIVLTGTLGRGAGAVLLAGLVAYVTLTILFERRRHTAAAELYEAEAESVEIPGTSPLVATLQFVGGLAVTLLGARLLVSGAVGLATDLGVSDAVIGLTVVAIGTSMPELVTSVVAARRGHGDVAFGNILGSNIFNILGILGITALVKPLAVPDVIADFDIWVMLAATALLVATSVSGWRITRTEGAILLACYVAYLAWLVAGI
jgi:cation:H+ antiporter